MKKKVLALSFVMALLAIAVVGGSLAWFTDTDSAVNTFTVGSVHIYQHEEFDSTKAGKLTPVNGTFDEANYENDNYIRKKVRVENTGKNDAYIQTFVAMPKDLVEKEALGFIYNTDAAAGEWTEMATVADIGDIDYVVYRYRYAEPVKPGDKTPYSLQYMYIASDVNANTYDTNNNGITDTIYLVKGTEEIDTVNINDGLHVYVFSQAVQKEGFSSAAEALDTAFPNEHPWVPVNP